MAKGKVQKDKVYADITDPQGVADDAFNEVKRHYDSAFDDTDQRKQREGGFDDVDKMHRTYIDPNTWPYQSIIADPRTFTFITEKDSRMFANKLRGRMEPREGGDVLGAKINNELFSFQWDNDNYGGTQLSKWAMTSQRTRKYGAGFKLEKWRYETRDGKCVFDGPTSRALNNADCGPDPAATCIEDCNYFQVRDWPTFHELESVNDAASSAPIYKNLDRLREAIGRETSKSKGGDRRDTRRQSVSKELLGLSDAIGDDRVFKTVEIVTEYRRDKWITFAPKYGVVLRDIPNPYGNNEIPIVMLKYYPVDDDLYGVSEVEPVMKLFKGINAFLSHGVDEANMKLYTPLKVRANAVRMHTIDYGGVSPKWIMNDPSTDVIPHETSSNNLQQLTQIYSTLVAASQEALGESSLGVSNIPGPLNGDKTATEVRQVSTEQKARDNFNQLFLQEAIQRQVMLWHSMNQKMLISKKGKQGYVMRIVGKDAIEFFQQQGLDGQGLSDEATQLMAENPSMDVDEMTTPLYPVNESEFEQETKFKMDDSGKAGTLVVEEKDLKGNYDYIADVESMALGALQNEKAGKQKFVQDLMANQNIEMMLAKQGWQIKSKDLLVDAAEDAGFKDAEKYFEQIQQPQLGGAVDPNTGLPVEGAGIDPTGAGIATQGLPNPGNGQVPGMGPIPQLPGY